MKYPIKFKQFVRKLTCYLKSEMYLHEWTIDVLYMEDDYENRAGAIDIGQSYFEAKIKIYPLLYRLWKEGKHEEVARVITHELCHTLTEPLYYIAEKNVSEKEYTYVNHIREQQTQRIANILFPLIPKKYYV